MATKLGSVVTYLEVLLIIMPFNALITSSLLGHVTKENHYISPNTISMATKRGKMLTYLQRLLPIQSHDRLIMRYCGVT